MKEKPISVRYESLDQEAILKAAQLEGSDPAAYIRSASVRFTRQHYPQVYEALETKEKPKK